LPAGAGLCSVTAAGSGTSAGTLLSGHWPGARLPRLGRWVTGEDWESWLRLAARLRGWSCANIMLIAAQRPEATSVARCEAWQARGRQVRKGEPGVAMIAEPPLASGKPGQPSPSARLGAAGQSVNAGWRTRVTCIWDFSQISGPDDNGRADLLTPEVLLPALWGPLVWLARGEGFAVERGDCGAVPGATTWSCHRIRIRPGLVRCAEALALIHEFGRVLAHDNLAIVPGASTAGCRGIREIEADSIAFIVAAWLGMDSATCSWPPMASWAGSDLLGIADSTPGALVLVRQDLHS
jgi:hypothetical protein